MNFTTLGYGDVVMSERWRLLGALEAANGILMFGVSTAMMTAAVIELLKLEAERTERQAEVKSAVHVIRLTPIPRAAARDARPGVIIDTANAPASANWNSRTSHSDSEPAPSAMAEPKMISIALHAIT